MLSNGQIEWYSDYNFHLVLRNGKWRIKHYGMLLSYLYEYLNPYHEMLVSSTITKNIDEISSEISETSKLIGVIRNLSARRKGALFIIVNHNIFVDPSLEDLTSLIPEEITTSSNSFKKIINSLETGNLDILKCDKFLIEAIASIDGATLLDRKLKIISFGELINSDGITNGKIFGARTKAALAGSNQGLSIKISEDGDVEVYKMEKLVLSIK